MAKKTARTTALTPAHRIILLVGKELFLQTEYTAHIRRLLAAEHGDVAVVRFDGQTTAAADVLDECRSFGLLHEHKLVVVDAAEQCVKESSRPLFERYAQAPSQGATLVLRADKFIPGKLGPMIEKVGAIIGCDVPTPEQAAAWVVRRCPERHRVEIAQDAALMLVERLGPELGRLNTELAKLAAALGPGDAQRITSDLVAELTGVTREEDMWSAQEPLLEGDPAAALARLRLIFGSNKDATVPVSYACLDLARKLHGASRGQRQGVRGSELARTIGLWGPRQDVVLAAGRRLEPGRAAALLAAAVEADQRSKSGLGEPERTLERLALRFTSEMS